MKQALFVRSQADLDQQWSEACLWAKESAPAGVLSFFLKLNETTPQPLDSKEWDVLSRMGILVIQEALTRNAATKEQPPTGPVGDLNDE